MTSGDRATPPAGTGPHRFRMESWVSCAPFERLLNISIVEATEGRAVLRMPFLVEFAQGAGLLHGGALVGLADTAVVIAIKRLLPPESHFATTQLEAKYLRPVTQGWVTARAKVVSREGRVLRGEATLYDDEERPVLEFASTFKVARNTKIRGVSFGDARCGAIVLAAGEARRFGAQKLLMPFGETTVLGAVVTALAAAGAAPIVVVVGTGEAGVAEALDGMPATLVRNPDPTRGMVSSVRVGAEALPAGIDCFLLALGDQPRVQPADIARLLQAQRETGKGIVLPTYRGKRGHPLLFRGHYRGEILALTDDQTLRDVVHGHADDLLEVPCESDACVRDIDTREDYAEEVRRARGEQ
jgi:acyl-CoA thioesterase